MTKADLIEEMAEGAGISRTAAGRALDAMLEAVMDSLKAGNRVSVVGFGTFSVASRRARNGRNPRTGEAISIKASRAPKFTPGRAFKEAVR